ncbi:Noc4l, partial [Symbiodinium microadriaticum]
LARPELQIQTLLTELLLELTASMSSIASLELHKVDCLMSEYVREYDDFRHYMMSHLRSCAEQVGKVSREPGSEVSKDTTVTDKGEEAEPPTKRKRLHGPFAEAAFQKGRSAEELFERLLALLKQAPEPDPVKAQDEEVTGELLLPTSRPLGHYRREYRKLFQEAWLKLLGLRVPLVHCSALLQLLPTSVIPHLSRPLLLSDFYLRAFHAGSLEISVLALSGLLLLLTRYGLGDPETLSASCGEFYSQLYSLLRPATFRLKRRARFQRLAAAALTSGLLPGGFAAAFAKKCLRVAIALPEPGSILWLLSLAYGLIQRNHSHCSFLLHREEIEGMSNLTKDTFDSEADLTQATKQVASSSLWEVQLLFRHHLPAVSTLAKLFERPFFKPTSRKLDPEIFLDQSVAKAYEQALKSADRQAARLKARGTTCPLAFQVEDDPLVLRVSGWAAALSTGQRRIGAGL